MLWSCNSDFPTFFAHILVFTRKEARFLQIFSYRITRKPESANLLLLIMWKEGVMLTCRIHFMARNEDQRWNCHSELVNLPHNFTSNAMLQWLFEESYSTWGRGREEKTRKTCLLPSHHRWFLFLPPSQPEATSIGWSSAYTHFKPLIGVQKGSILRKMFHTF